MASTARETRSSAEAGLLLDRLLAKIDTRPLNERSVRVATTDAHRISILLDSDKVAREELVCIVQVRSHILAYQEAIDHANTNLLQLYIDAGMTRARTTVHDLARLALDANKHEHLKVCLKYLNQAAITRLMHEAIRRGHKSCVVVMIEAGVAITQKVIVTALVANKLVLAKFFLELEEYDGTEPFALDDNIDQANQLTVLKLLSSHVVDTVFNTGSPECNQWMRDTVSVFHSTKLHFFFYHSPPYVRELLRAGANPLEIDMSSFETPTPAAIYQATLGINVYNEQRFPRPSPYSIALAAPHLRNAQLILKSMEWSPDTHELFPAEMRTRARDLIFLGRLLSYQDRFATCQRAIADVWFHNVIRFAVCRE